MDDRIRQIAIERLRHGDPLPIEYRDELFPPKGECELVYRGKLPEEQLLADTLAVPLQPTTTVGAGKTGDEWANMLIFGDNLQAMRTLIQEKEAGELCNADGTPGARLIYIDPPFATRRDFSGSKDEPAYRDKVVGAQFIEFLRRRLILIHRLLSDDGAVYVHLDEKKSHYAKVVLDEVFGEQGFQREIVWRMGWISGYKSAARNWIRNHDVLLFYTRRRDFVFNKSYIPFKEDYVRRDGKRPTGQGHPLEDTWNCSDADTLNSIQIMSFSGEKTGFPTQKNERLLARVIEASSNPGDLVLDAFAGSGTTCAVADKLGRRWIGIDSSKLAIYQTQKRLLNLRSEIGNTGDPHPASRFTVFNAGLYDFSSLRELPWGKWLFFALQLFGCKHDEHEIGGLQLHGRRQGASALVFDHLKNVGRRISEATVQDIHTALKGRIGSRFFIIAPRAVFDFQQDYIDLDGTRYYALRIPYSWINELHSRSFTSLSQPSDEEDVNAAVDAVGFDFITPPTVTWSVRPSSDPSKNLRTLVVEEFKSNARIRSASRARPVSLEALSMVMLDLDYDGAVFQPDVVAFSQELKVAGYALEFEAEKVGDQAMVVFLDLYGNEAREIIPAAMIGSVTESATRGPSKKAGKKLAKKAGKKAGKRPTKKAGKKTTKKAGKRPTKKAGKKRTKKAGNKTTKKAGKKTTKKAGNKTTKKAGKRPAKKPGKRATKSAPGARKRGQK